MKKLIIIFIIFILIISFLIGGTIYLIINRRPKTDTEEKVYLPEVVIHDIKENQFKINKIEKDSILVFWLPQSKSSKLQLKALNNIYQDHKENIDILAIAIGNIDHNQLSDIKEKYKLDFPLLIDLKVELTEKMQISTIPTLVFYKPYGEPTIKYGLINELKLEKLINTYLK
ncbi:TlpA family protein disulfide reductase [Halonatronum saccharophilum]|uniref:TlpA family protein disulfide reductase n=1 Tax=Halonatronum saccharophilum TaxID=150060 RepID=UPI000480695B|nr:redoxin domain-containing protein [Halonatronum saccharophilum]